MTDFIEILSPAGSYEAFEAALAAGCDAVYLGGVDFGARAFAKNFTSDELSQAIEVAHQQQIKIYYTINTLFKETELKDLFQVILSCLQAGVDAFIVQDLGVLKMLKTHFPEVEVHGSTQMNCHSTGHVKLLEDYGLNRIVLSREMTLSQIKAIKEASHIDIEAFVHGALCYCYSGQCLMSSMIGGRSGNRGRCAQPCRLNYEVKIDGISVSKSYILSPKDIATLELLPDIIASGVTSLKIEGRMKSPEYVGLMTLIYRKYLDRYLNHQPYEVKQEDLEEMAQMYNRGGFSAGYYEGKHGASMMALNRPNHLGVKVGSIIETTKDHVKIAFETAILQGDALEIIDVKNTGSYPSFVCKMAYTNEGTFQKNIVGDAKTGDSVYRLKSIALNQEVRARLNKAIEKEKINFELTLIVNKLAQLKAIGKTTVVTYGDNVQAATGLGLSEEQLLKQMSKLGDSPYVLDKLDIIMPVPAFMPVSSLNQLRREAISLLTQQDKISIQRKNESYKLDQSYPSREIVKSKGKNDKILTILLRKSYQFDIIMSYDAIGRIYFDLGSFDLTQLGSCLKKCRANGIFAYLALPKIVKDHDASKLISMIHGLDVDDYQGFLVKSLDGYSCVTSFKKRIIFDYDLNIMNHEAIDFLREQENYEGFHPSLELSRSELEKLELQEAEQLVYGYFPVMTSQQCVLKTIKGCKVGHNHQVTLTDRLNNEMKVESVCSFCQTNNYNPMPLVLIDRIDSLNKLGFSSYRLAFLDEDVTRIRQLLDLMVLKIKGVTNTSLEKETIESIGAYTRGQFHRGIL